MGACLSAGPRTLGSEASTAFTEGARLHQEGRHDEAALAFDRAAEADPLDLDAWLAAARAHAGVLHVVDAKRCLERAHALDAIGALATFFREKKQSGDMHTDI